MINMQTAIYTRSRDLPAITDTDFFHGKTLFGLYEQTPRIKPYMVVATCGGRVVGHLLATVRYRTSLMPPYIYMHCRVIGEGAYSGDVRKDEVFGRMLQTLTRKFQNKVLYMEFSNLSTKMFGYRQFRAAGFFPVNWMSIHNSLHNKTPEERLDDKMKRRIKAATAKGVTTIPVECEDDFKAFMHLLKHHNRFKPKRYIPDEIFFRGIMEKGCGTLFVTKYRQRVIGCCASAYHAGNAYLWYFAFLRKSYAILHPDILTIWKAIKNAHSRGCGHIVFMDVGLPFRKNRFREFILRFGGKPVSSYRWFRVSNRWVNSLMSWIYRG